MATVQEYIQTWVGNLKKQPGKYIEKLKKEVRSTTNLPPGFWDLWRAHKDEIKRSGLGVSKNPRTDQWELALWSTSEAPVTKTVEPPKDISPVKLSPEIESKLLPYQRKHASDLATKLKKSTTALDASDTGTGKTYSALAVAKQLNLRPIIIAPKSVQKDWKKVLSHFGIEGADVVNWELAKTGKKRNEKGKSIPAGFITKVEKDIAWNVAPDQMIIFDEIHNAKNAKTQNAQMVKAAGKTNANILMLSATMAENPLNFKAVGETLRLFHGDSGFFAWARQYGGTTELIPGGRGAKHFVFRGTSKDLVRLHDDMTEKMARMRIKDIPDFPETQIIAKAYDLDPADVNKLNRLYDEVKAEHDEKGDPAAAMVALGRARQESERMKIPVFQEMAQDAIDGGQSVALFVNYKETAKALKDMFGDDAVLYWGEDTNPESREQAKADFQSNKKRIFIATTATGKQSISLHDLEGDHPRLAIISPTNSAQDLKQAFGRVHRAGAKTKSLQRVVFAADTIEEKVMENVNAKLRNIEAFNDGDLALFTFEEGAIQQAKEKKNQDITKKQSPEDFEPLVTETISEFARGDVSTAVKSALSQQKELYESVEKEAVEQFTREEVEAAETEVTQALSTEAGKIEYEGRRSQKSLDRDRRINAKTVYPAPTEAWLKDPTHSDVQGIDTIGAKDAAYVDCPRRLSLRDSADVVGYAPPTGYIDHDSVITKTSELKGVTIADVVLAKEMVQIYHVSELPPWLRDQKGMQGKEFVRVLKSFEELEKAFSTVTELPATQFHVEDSFPAVDSPVVLSMVKGIHPDKKCRCVKGKIYFVDKKWPQAVIESVKRGDITAVSIGGTTEFGDGGFWNGEPYDLSQKNIKGGHLAVLPGVEGRCPRGLCGVNLADAQSNVTENENGQAPARDHGHFYEEKFATPTFTQSIFQLPENNNSIIDITGSGQIEGKLLAIEDVEIMANPDDVQKFQDMVAAKNAEIAELRKELGSFKDSATTKKIKELEDMNNAAKDQFTALKSENAKLKDDAAKLEERVKEADTFRHSLYDQALLGTPAYKGKEKELVAMPLAEKAIVFRTAQALGAVKLADAAILAVGFTKPTGEQRQHFMDSGGKARQLMPDPTFDQPKEGDK